MAEVFQGTPAIVSVTIGDQEGKQVTYHVAGRDMGVVKDAVRTALAAIPDEAEDRPTKSHRKPRRTKAEMAAAQDAPQTESREKAASSSGGKPWAD